MPSLGKAIRLVVLPSLLLISAMNLPVSAGVVVRDQTNNLNGVSPSATVKLIEVHAVVTKDLVGASWLYTYKYNVNYKEGTAALHFFGLANPSDIPFINAANTASFTNPTYVAKPGGWPNNVQWTAPDGISMPVGATREFSYQSYYAPQDVGVYCYAIDGGAGANGLTVGMGDMIPEPGSILALACGLLGVAPKLARRRK